MASFASPSQCKLFPSRTLNETFVMFTFTIYSNDGGIWYSRVILRTQFLLSTNANDLCSQTRIVWKNPALRTYFLLTISHVTCGLTPEYKVVSSFLLQSGMSTQSPAFFFILIIQFISMRGTYIYLNIIITALRLLNREYGSLNDTVWTNT